MGRAVATLLVALFVVFVASSASALTSDPELRKAGSQNLPMPDTLVLTSSEVETLVWFAEDSTASKPRVEVWANWKVSASDVLRLNSDGTAAVYDAEASNAATTTAPGGLALPLLMTAALLATVASSRSSSTAANTATVLAALAATTAATMVLAQDASPESPHRVELRVVYPTGHRFAKLQFTLNDGAALSEIGQLHVGELSVVANTTRQGYMSLVDVQFDTLLSLTSPAMISAERVAYTAASRDASSPVLLLDSAEAQVFLSFLTDGHPRGRFGLAYSSLDNMPSNCSAVTSTGTGRGWADCSGGSGNGATEVVTLAAPKGSVTVLFDAASGSGGVCTLPPPVDNVASPALTTTWPARSWDLSAPALWNASTANTKGLLTSAAADGSLRVERGNTDLWAGMALYQVEGTFAPISLMPTLTYRFNFSLRADDANTGTIGNNIVAALWKRREYYVVANESRNMYWSGDDQRIPMGPMSWSLRPPFSLVQTSAAMSPPTIPKGDWRQYSWTFSVPSYVHFPILGVYFNSTSKGPAVFYATGQTFELIGAGTANTPGSLITPANSATQPRQNTTLEANPRDASTCPHLSGTLSPWEDPTTWPSGVVPAYGSSVTLPENRRVLVGGCSVNYVPFDEVVVPASSELIFADELIYFNARTLRVDGALRVGGPGCRMLSRITLGFFGTQSTVAADGKGIVSSPGSTVEIFGKQYAPTWTRLASPALPGRDRVWLQHAVNWEPGQQVLLVSGFAVEDDPGSDMNEVMTVYAVGGAGKVVQFTEPIKYYHHASSDYQMEVGLLSRRVRIMGDAGSDTTLFGAHVMMMGAGRVAGVEVVRGGQFNILARYPLHYHMAGYSPTSYLTDNSIHDSFFRCAVVHGTNNTRVLNNVAYRTHGHCFYLEEGNEEMNEVSYNLGAHIQIIGAFSVGNAQFQNNITETADRVQPSDSAASCFYISNAQNRLVGNAASGGWSSYIFPVLVNPIGLSRDVRLSWSPKDKQILEFRGNSAHGSANYWMGFSGAIYTAGAIWHDEKTGLLQYNGGRIQEAYGQRYTRNAATGVRENFKLDAGNRVWLSGQGCNHWGADVYFSGWELYDLSRGMTLFGPSIAADTLMAMTNNPLGWPDISNYGYPTTSSMGSSRGRQGWQFYDQWSMVVLANVTFRDWQIPALHTERAWNVNQTAYAPPLDPSYGTNCISVLQNNDESTNQGISGTVGIKFTNTTGPRNPDLVVQNIEKEARQSSNMYDSDGSVVSQTGLFPAGTDYIIGSASNFWNAHAACVFHTPWNSWICPNGTNNLNIVNVRFLLNGVSASDSEAMGKVQICNAPTKNSTFTWKVHSASGLTGNIWHLVLADKFRQPKELVITPSKVQYPKGVVVAINYPTSTQASAFTVTYKQDWNAITATTTAVGSVAALGPHKYFWDAGKGTLYVYVHRAYDNPYAASLSARGVVIDTIDYSNSFTVKCSSCTMGQSVPTAC